MENNLFAYLYKEMFPLSPITSPTLSATYKTLAVGLLPSCTAKARPIYARSGRVGTELSVGHKPILNKSKDKGFTLAQQLF